MLNKLENTRLSDISIFGKIDLTAELFSKLIAKVEKINLCSCEVSNELVTDEIFEMLAEEKCTKLIIYPSTSYAYNYSSKTETTVSDKFLLKIKASKNVMLFGRFLTKFTIEAIKQIMDTNYCSFLDYDFGIIDANQTEAAEYLMEIHNAGREFVRMRKELISFDGFRISRYSFNNMCFAVPVESPSAVLTIDEEWTLFENHHLGIFNEEIQRSKLIIIYGSSYPQFEYLHHLYENKYEPAPYCSIMLRMERLSQSDDKLRTSIVTKIDESNAAKLIKAFLSKVNDHLVLNEQEEDVSFTDEILVRLAKIENPVHFAISGHKTSFTIQGIKEFLKSNSIHNENFWNFGILDKGQEVDAVRFLSSIHLDPESSWIIESTNWVDGFLYGFKLLARNSKPHCISAELAIATENNMVVKEMKSGAANEKVNELNYQGLLFLSDNVEDCEEFLIRNWTRMDRLEVLSIIYENHLSALKRNFLEYLNENSGDNILKDRFFSLAYDLQAFILDMFYNRHFEFEDDSSGSPFYYDDNYDSNDYYNSSLDSYHYSNDSW